MLKKLSFSVLLGAAFGASITIALGYWFTGNLPLKNTDVFSFVITTLAIIVSVFTIIGAFAVINTWNDIEKKGREIQDHFAEKFQREATQSIQKFQEETSRGIESFQAAANKYEKEIETIKKSSDEQTSLLDDLENIIVSVLYALIIQAASKFFCRDYLKIVISRRMILVIKLPLQNDLLERCAYNSA